MAVMQIQHHGEMVLLFINIKTLLMVVVFLRVNLALIKMINIKLMDSLKIIDKSGNGHGNMVIIS